jgi:hypothetical protein
MPRRPSKKKSEPSVKSKSSKTTKNEKTTKTVKSSRSTKSTKTIKSVRPKLRKSVRKQQNTTTNNGMGIGGISTAARQFVRALKNPDELKNIRFYDDSEENIEDVQKDFNIECIHVPRTDTTPKGRSQGGEEHEYIRYIRDHGKWDLDNKDSDLYDVLCFYHESPQMQEDEVSEGLTEKHINELLQWTRKNPNAKCVIFDFDRVLNRVEGVIGYDTVAEIRKYHLKPSGLAKYHLGSKRRMIKLKKMFDELVRRGIDVRIVTNNTAAGCELFTEILKCIHPVFNKKTIHGSYDHDTKLHCIREFILR